MGSPRRRAVAYAVGGMCGLLAAAALVVAVVGAAGGHDPTMWVWVAVGAAAASIAVLFAA